MIKLRTVALTVSLLLGVGVFAQASSSSDGGKSPSLRSGFSSQRSAPAGSGRPAMPAPSRGKPQFGGFGRSAPAPSPSRSGGYGKASDSAARGPQKSVLTNNLEEFSARDNAVRTLDARRAAAAPPAPAPATMPHQSSTPVQTVPPVIVQQGNGIGDLLTGFMLGRASSGGHGVNNTGSSATQPGAVPAVPQSSFGASVLRTFLWLLILSAIGWAIYFALRRYARVRQNRTPNYTFERE
jgi:hypothetical protein